ncbi:MAG: LamG domain-containing protein, partial [Verrucomicrobiales bacterium]|nr:LamG domain-containing protein [Verrucomicrobiales bacterium]
SLSSDWHHVAAVKSADSLKLFLDGQLVSASARRTGDRHDLDSGAPWRIGAGKNGPLNGLLADLRVYRQALEPSVIRTLAAQSPAR